MLPKFLKLDRPLDLPPQLKWKFAHEPELMGWTIRARNYNTFVANGLFLFMSVFLAWLTYALYIPPSFGKSHLSSLMMSVGFYSLGTLLLLSMTHQRMKFAYRITTSGIEVCEWKVFPEWALTLLKWLPPFTAILFLFLATIDSNFLLGALVGPGGLGLMYLSMANSTSFREMHTEYHHLIYEWKDLTQLAIATNRKDVVDFKFTHFNERLGRIVTWNQNIFCNHRKRQLVADFITPYLSPDVPVLRAKVNVPLSTD